MTTAIAYDGWKPVVERDLSGNLKAVNIYGAGPDEILWRSVAGVGDFRYHHDARGNVTFVLDGGGNLAEKYSYDAFGKPKIMDWNGNERSESAIGNRFLFQGREWIGELGIYDYRHRMYNPDLGRFLQTDPTGFDAGDMNLFRYCGDDPVDGSDPMGLFDMWGNRHNFFSGNPSMNTVLAAWNAEWLAKLLGLGSKQVAANGPTKLTRKLEPGFSVDTYDKDTGTIWIHRRWVYTLSNDSGPVVGVRVKETISMSNMKDYKDFPRKTGSEVTDRYGRVYDNWKVGFSSKNGQVTVTQGLFVPGASGTAVHSVTIGASNGGWHQFNNPKNEEDVVTFK